MIYGPKVHLWSYSILIFNSSCDDQNITTHVLFFCILLVELFTGEGPAVVLPTIDTAIDESGKGMAECLPWSPYRFRCRDRNACYYKYHRSFLSFLSCVFVLALYLVSLFFIFLWPPYVGVFLIFFVFFHPNSSFLFLLGTDVLLLAELRFSLRHLYSV